MFNNVKMGLKYYIYKLFFIFVIYIILFNNMFNIICNIILNVVKLSLAETVIIDMIPNITKNILGLFKFFIIHI